MNALLLASVLIAAAGTSTSTAPLAVADELAAPRAGAAEAPVEDVVVTAARKSQSQKDAPVATEVISRQSIESSGAENLTELLEEQPGVELQRSASGVAVRLQGLEPEHVLFLVDGERVPGRFRGALDPTRFGLDDIARVEIVKGASSALYGSEAIGGVINLITRDSGRPFESEARAVAGGLGTYDLTGGVGARTERLRTRLSGGHHRSNGYDRNPADVSTTGAAFRGFNLGNRSELRVSDALRLRGQADYRRLDQTAIDGRPTGAIFDRRQRTEALSASLRPELALGDEATLSTSLRYAWFRLQVLQDQRNSAAEDSLDDDRQHLGQLTLQYDTPLGPRHRLTAGIEGLVERERVAFLSGGGAERQRGAAYLQDEWKVLSERTPLTVVPGLRADLDSQFGARLSPKLAARFDPRSDLVLRASFGLGFRAPAFEELFLRFSNPGSGYLVVGNPNLEPESAYGLNAGAEWRPRRLAGLGLSWSGFWNRIENLIETRRKLTCTAVQASDCVLPGAQSEFAYVNVANAETRGFEAGAQLGPRAGFSLEVGYAFTWTRDLTADRALAGRARHRGTAQVAYRDPRLGLDATLRASVLGERPFFEDLDADGALDVAAPAATLDARVAQDLFDRLTVFAGVENALDAGDAQLFPIPPRTFHAGLAARYEVDADPEDPRRTDPSP